jgi:3-dehydroquinate dehydratase-2
MKLLLIHGPNLNFLGKREPGRYGNFSSEDIVNHLRKLPEGRQLDYFQSNIEGEIVNAIQEAGSTHEGILINPGAFSHTSIAIADAIRSIGIPACCVHITNIYLRESYRHIDIVGDACEGSIVGLGVEGYRLAMECLSDYIRTKKHLS